jgi:hypothetical protein
MENEAVMAARLVKIESLIASLRSVLGDLEASMSAWVTPTDFTAKRPTETDGNGVPEREFGTLAWRYAQLLEEALATALSRIRTGAGSSGEHPIRGADQHFDARASTDLGANDWPKSPEEERA